MLPPGQAPTFSGRDLLDYLAKANMLNDQHGHSGYAMDHEFHDLQRLTPERFSQLYYTDTMRDHVMEMLKLASNLPAGFQKYVRSGATPHYFMDLLKNFEEKDLPMEAFDQYGRSLNPGLASLLRRHMNAPDEVSPEDYQKLVSGLDAIMPDLDKYALDYGGPRYEDSAPLETEHLLKLIQAAELPDRAGAPEPSIEPPGASQPSIPSPQSPAMPQTPPLPNPQMIKLLMELYDFRGGRRAQPDVTELLNTPELPNLLGEG